MNIKNKSFYVSYREEFSFYILRNKNKEKIVGKGILRTHQHVCTLYTFTIVLNINIG